MSARPDLCGGYRVSGIPTAINSWRTRVAEITRARCAAEHPGMNILWAGGVPRQRAD
jgi:hypothetical protein